MCAVQVGLRSQSWSLLIAVLFGLTLVAGPANARSPQLAARAGTPPVAEPGWRTLHYMDGLAIGILSGDDAPAGIVPLATYDDPARFMLIAEPDFALLQSGDLPSAWRVALSHAVDPNQLRAIPALARDGAQVLIRLPDALAAVAALPGGRCQLLPTPAAVRLARPAPQRPSRDHGAEFWQALSDATNSARLFADLDYLATELQTRFAITPQMELACEYTFACFEGLGLDTWYDPFVWNEYDLKNVVGAKLGTIAPDQIYIICGHLDSISPEPETEAPGAEDNGSGAASVLEAARLLAPFDTDHTIYFICFSAEEEGLIGSEHFASQAELQGLDIRGVLNLDMVGYYEAGDADLWLEGFHTGVSSVWLMDLVGENAELYTDLEIYMYPGNGWGSDHVPFHNHGYPAILSIENEWDSYPCYHATCDEVTWLDADLWRGISAVNVVSLAQLAQVQADLGTLVGSVSAAGGDRLVDVTLTLTGTGYAERVSDPNGEFSWVGIFPGHYRVTAEKYGFLPATAEVDVPSGGTGTIAIELEPSLAGVAENSGDATGVLAVHPSPMTAATSILMQLAAAQAGRLAVYDPAGRRVAHLASGRFPAGEYRFAWDGGNLPAGIYHVRFESRVVRHTRAVTLLR